MTETAAQYIAGIEVERRDNYCRRCDVYHGTEINDGALLENGNMQIQKVIYICKRCGEELSWASSDRHLRRIIDKKKKRSHNRTTSV